MKTGAVLALTTFLAALWMSPTYPGAVILGGWLVSSFAFVEQNRRLFPSWLIGALVANGSAWGGYNAGLWAMGWPLSFEPWLGLFVIYGAILGGLLPLWSVFLSALSRHRAIRRNPSGS